MSEDRPGIVQYVDNIKENMGGNWINSLFHSILENKSSCEQILWYMRNLENQPITYTLCVGKNEKLAKEHRETGNRCFTDNNFVAALASYNKSISCGRKSDNLSLCYANRSAVYFELGMFQKCLENIKMAKELKYPINLMPKLNKRAEDARRGLLKSEVMNMQLDCFSKLSKPVSNEQPFLINCLEGNKLNDLKKREIRTKCDLVAGDIISMEMKAFSKVLKSKLFYSHCSYCLSTDAGMSLIPCTFCSTVMFCNEECYRKASDSFHKIECPIIDAIDGMLSESMWLGFRTVLIAINLCGSVEKYKQFLSDLSDKRENIFDQIFLESDYHVEDNSHDLDLYRAILNLPVNEDFSLEDCVGTAFALKLLKEHSELVNNDNIKFLATLIYDSMKIARDNALLLEETYSMMGLSNEITFYGRAFYPFACNFNLSCAPNVLLLNHKNSMLGVVMRPISPDGVLYAGLASINHVTSDRKYRKNLKRANLGKDCDCIACLKNYGRMEKLQVLPNVPQPTLPNHLALAAFIDRKGNEIKKQYKFFCDYLNSHSDLEYLSFQTAGAITQLLFTLGKMAHPQAIEMKLGESLGEKI